MNMRLEYEVTKNDLAQYANSIIRLQNNLGLNVLFIIISSLFIMVAVHAMHTNHTVTILYLTKYLSPIKLSTIRDIIAFTASIITISLVITLNIKHNYYQLLSSRIKKMTISCNNHGMDIQQDDNYSYRPWHITKAIIRSNYAIYLYNADHQTPASSESKCIIIPQQVFSTKQAFIHFEGFVEQHASSTQRIA